MKRAAGQAGKAVAWALHHAGMMLITVFLVLAGALGIGAYRLSQGPVQLPWLASRLANVVSGRAIDIHIDKAALAWGGYRQGGEVPLYLELGGITARDAAGVPLVTIRSGRLVVLPSALLGGKAPILVSSTDTYFQGSNVPLGMEAAIQLGGFFKFWRASIHVSMGAGALGANGVAVPINGGRFDMDVGRRAVSVTSGVLRLAQRGTSTPTVRFGGQAALDGVWRGTLSVQADELGADDLHYYWPAAVLAQTRHWVTKNISAGTAGDANFVFGLCARQDLSGLQLDSAEGTFAGHGLSIGWIPHAQPITGVSGIFKLTDLGNIFITDDSGRLGGVSLANGTMHIFGLEQETQIGAFSIPVSGRVQDVLQVLGAPPLNVLKAAPAVLLGATGSVRGTVAARLPLRGDLRLAQVDLHADADLSDVMVPAGGLSMTDGILHLHTTLMALTLDGGARLAGRAATVKTTAAFGAGAPQIDFLLTSVAGANLLGMAGVSAAAGSAQQAVAGDVPFTLHVSQGAAGRGEAVLTADLTPAGVGVAALGWTKEAGVEGTMTVRAALSGQDLEGISGVSARAPGLDIEAVGTGRRLDFSAFDVGGTKAVGSLTAPAKAGGAWEADFSGPVLDVSALVNPPRLQGKARAKRPPRPARPEAIAPSGPVWSAALRFGTLVMAKQGAPVLHGLVFDGRGQGTAVMAARAVAVGDGEISVDVSPMAGAMHTQSIAVRTGDGGFLLRALGAFGNVDGGELDFVATAADDGTVGVVKLDRFRLMHAPGFAKILQALSIYGAAAAASGPGVAFDHLVAPFALASGILTLKGARAFSSSLGFTASGTVDLADGETDLSTTIVPAYALNSLPGKIPVVGKFFAPEQGGGLFAMRAKITGPLEDPDVSVNPLSALTPGVLRDLFGLAAPAAGTK